MLPNNTFVANKVDIHSYGVMNKPTVHQYVCNKAAPPMTDMWQTFHK